VLKIERVSYAQTAECPSDEEKSEEGKDGKEEEKSEEKKEEKNEEKNQKDDENRHDAETLSYICSQLGKVRFREALDPLSHTASELESPPPEA
jgi:hypothetical protein